MATSMDDAGHIDDANDRADARIDWESANETQEIEDDTDESESQSENVAGARVKRLNSNAYKPFGTRSSAPQGQQCYATCQGGPGRKKGTKKKCGMKVEDNEDGVCCDGCKFWFHLNCQKVQPATYEALQKVKGLFWLCWECRSNLPCLARSKGTTEEEQKYKLLAENQEEKMKE